jgi:hypothetical protein
MCQVARELLHPAVSPGSPLLPVRRTASLSVVVGDMAALFLLVLLNFRLVYRPLKGPWRHAADLLLQ